MNAANLCMGNVFSWFFYQLVDEEAEGEDNVIVGIVIAILLLSGGGGEWLRVDMCC